MDSNGVTPGGETPQSHDPDFYSYRRNPGQAPESPFSEGELWPEEEPLAPGSYVNDGEAGGDGDGDPDDGDFDTDDAFAIKINGSAPTTDGQGQPVYASSYTISVNSGDVTFKGPNVLGGEIGPETLSLSSGVSATFPVADGKNKFYIAYGKVVFTRVGGVVSGQINGISAGSSSIVVEESTSHNFIEGWSDLDTTSPVWMFKIGSVAGQKQGINRYVFVNQIQVGNLVYGEAEDTPGSFLVYRADGTEETVNLASIMAGYDDEDNWFVEFKVENGRLKDFSGDPPIGTSNSERYDGDAPSSTDQTVYRRKIIKKINGAKVTFSMDGGVYRENVQCTPDGPQVEIIQI